MTKNEPWVHAVVLNGQLYFLTYRLVLGMGMSWKSDCSRIKKRKALKKTNVPKRHSIRLKNRKDKAEANTRVDTFETIRDWLDTLNKEVTLAAIRNRHNKRNLAEYYAGRFNEFVEWVENRQTKPLQVAIIRNKHTTYEDFLEFQKDHDPNAIQFYWRKKQEAPEVYAEDNISDPPLRGKNEVTEGLDVHKTHSCVMEAIQALVKYGRLSQEEASSLIIKHTSSLLDVDLEVSGSGDDWI